MSHIFCNLLKIMHNTYNFPGLPQWLSSNLPAVHEFQGTQVQSLVWENPLEEGLATHPSVLAWRIPWTEEPGRV